jgi:hypothetical protein
MGVVVAMVAGDFLSQERRTVVRLVRVRQLHLGDDQSLVVTVELINLEGMPISDRHKEASFVDDAGLAKVKQLSCLLNGDFLLELIATEASVERRSLDGKESLLVAQTNTYGMSVAAADIALLDVVAPLSETFVAVVTHQELPLNLQHF